MIVTKEKSLSNANIATITEQFILVNSLEFLKALRKVVNATAGKKCPYPVLQYVHVRIESDCLIIEACDSLVLDLLTVSASVEPELIGKDFLISKSFVKSLVKAPHKFGSSLCIINEFNELDFDGNELDDIQSKFNMYGNKYGFFVIKGMLNADQIKSLKQQSIKKSKTNS